ncbi:unnamed protein product, partial [Hapterophycus canaliculatus]
VTQHCVERGRLLDRIWRSLNDLFEFVLSEMARTVTRCERRMEFMGALVEQERVDNESREATHKNELQLVEELLNGRWSKKLRQLQEQEIRYGSIVAANERTVTNIKHWLPNFGTYAGSVLSKVLPPLPPFPSQGGGIETSLVSPQEALEQDLKRIEAAGLWYVITDGGGDDGGSSDTSINSSSSRGSGSSCSSSSSSSSSSSVRSKDSGSSSSSSSSSSDCRSSTGGSGSSSDGGNNKPAPATTARSTPRGAAKNAATSSPPGSPAAAVAAAGSEKNTKSPKPRTHSKKRGRADSKMVAILVQREQEAAVQAEALTKVAKLAEENAARI